MEGVQLALDVGAPLCERLCERLGEGPELAVRVMLSDGVPVRELVPVAVPVRLGLLVGVALRVCP